MKWFKHDSDAGNDAKLRKLRLKYGATGYGIYWYLLELVARNVEKHNLTFELEHDADLVADDFKLSSELVQEMMHFMVSQGLFENNAEGRITCLKMRTRTDEYTTKLLHKANSCPDNVPTTSGQSPRKSELREEKRREEKRREIPPSFEEAQEFFTQKGYGHCTSRFMSYYEGVGWKTNRGKKITDWRRAASGWMSRETNKPSYQDRLLTGG